MSKLKLAVQSIVEDLNSEESTIIETMDNWTDWLFRMILILGGPFFLFTIWKFLTL